MLPVTDVPKAQDPGESSKPLNLINMIRKINSSQFAFPIPLTLKLYKKDESKPPLTDLDPMKPHTL